MMSSPLRIGRLAVGLTALVLSLAAAALAPAAAASLSGEAQADRATQLLFEAVHTDDFAGAEAAVAAGASIEAHDRWNSTPVELAVDKGYFRIAHFLVSVRNNRQQTAAVNAGTVRPTESGPTSTAAAAPSPAPTQAPAPAQKRAATVTPTPAVALAPATWPTDRPNPFDPGAPAFGTGLPVVGQIRSALPGAAGATPEGPLLATDTPAAGASESMR